MWSKDELGGAIYQHLITIKGATGPASVSGTFLLISTSSTPINSESVLPVGLAMNGLGATTIDSLLSLEGYGIKQSNGNIVFKGIVDGGSGGIQEASHTINTSDYGSHSFTDVVTKI